MHTQREIVREEKKKKTNNTFEWQGENDQITIKF